MVVVVLGGSPIRPQLSRQTISGAGTPIAVHSMVIVSPSSTVTSATGGRVTVGIADNSATITNQVNGNQNCDIHAVFTCTYCFPRWIRVSGRNKILQNVKFCNASKLGKRSHRVWYTYHIRSRLSDHDSPSLRRSDTMQGHTGRPCCTGTRLFDTESQERPCLKPHFHTTHVVTYSTHLYFRYTQWSMK